MSQSLNPFSWLLERSLSSTGRIFLAFVMGTLFALLPMYYVYTDRDAVSPVATPPDATVQQVPSQPHVPAAPAVAAGGADRFAARMTYELGQTAEEPATLAAPRTGASRSAAAPDAAGVGSASARTPAEERAASRIANARPISTIPPEARDTTREIEKEARRAEYREPPQRPVVKSGGDVQPRVVEGRDLVLPPKPPAAVTRPIGASPPTPVAGADLVEGEPNRRMIDSAVAFMAAQDRRSIESQAVIAGSPPVVRVTPIGPAPEATQRAEPARIAAAQAAPDPARTVSSDIESRLAATREWLTGAPQTTHTIQILGAASEERLKSQLKTLSKVLEPSRLYVYRTTAQGKPAMTVVYGDYADRKTALQALEKLPPAVSANRPVVRTVSGIRAEQKQNGVKAEP